MNLLELDVNILRLIYNRLVKRRNPNWSDYDVFSGRAAKTARACFVILAKKLQKLQVSPKKYLLVMSCYGHFERSKHLPLPGYLCSDKALAVYKWLSVKEARKYFDEEQMVKGLTVGREANSTEILGAVKESVEQMQKIPTNHKNPAVIFALRDGLKPWYLVLHKQFMQSEYFEMLDKIERSEIKQCGLFFKYHPKVKAKALELINE